MKLKKLHGMKKPLFHMPLMTVFSTTSCRALQHLQAVSRVPSTLVGPAALLRTYPEGGPRFGTAGPSAS
eukprot:2262370-Prorocentrum_lima.AAC.1